MNTYVVVFRGDASTGGFPIAISADPTPVRMALEAGLREIWAFTHGVGTDKALRAKARGNISAIQEALAEVGQGVDEPAT
jgi:hypothetical protein